MTCEHRWVTNVGGGVVLFKVCADCNVPRDAWLEAEVARLAARADEYHALAIAAEDERKAIAAQRDQLARETWNLGTAKEEAEDALRDARGACFAAEYELAQLRIDLALMHGAAELDTERLLAQSNARAELEVALDRAGFRVAPDLQGAPTLWCIECKRDSGFHYWTCSKSNPKPLLESLRLLRVQIQPYSVESWYDYCRPGGQSFESLDVRPGVLADRGDYARAAMKTLGDLLRAMGST